MCVTLRTIASAHNDRQHYNSWVGSTGWVRTGKSADVEQFQSLADDIRNDYKKLPQITANGAALRTGTG